MAGRSSGAEAAADLIFIGGGAAMYHASASSRRINPASNGTIEL
jgi:hypothetical protein